MADLDITGRVVVDATQAEGAFKKVGASADKMAKDIEGSANKAGKAVDGIGDGAEQGAQKFTRAGAQIRYEIQRSTLSLEQFGKTASQKLELKITAKGLDPAQFAPYLTKLKEVEAAQLAASASTDKAGASFAGLGGNLALATRALGALGLAFSVKEFIKLADVSTNVASRLNLVTSSAAELASVQQLLYSVAQASRVPFADLVGTYAQLARSTKDLGVSQTSLLGVVNTISQAVTISGGSAQSAQAALVQLSQGFASGTLRGEELNSVLEQTPRLAMAIAEGLGVSIGQLRALGAAGELTAEKVLGALEKSAAAVSKEFDQMVVTVEGASTRAANSVLKLVGAFDKLTGGSSAIASAITSISRALDIASESMDKFGSQGALREATRDVLSLDEAAKRVKARLDSGVVGPQTQQDLDRLNVRLAEAKRRFNELYEASKGIAPGSSSSANYGNESAREASRQREIQNLAKLAEDGNAYRLKRDGVPKSYISDMQELIRLNQAGVIVGKEYTDALKQQQEILMKKTGSTNDAVRAAKKEESAYATLIASIKSKIEANKLELAGGADLTESQKIRVKLDQDLLAGRVKLTAADEKSVRLALDSLGVTEDAEKAVKKLAEAQKESVKAVLALSKAREDEYKKEAASIVSIEAKAQAIEDEIANYGLTEQAIASLGVARLQEKADLLSTFEGSERVVELLNEEITARKRLALAQDGITGKKAATKAAADAASEWKKASDKIESSLTDALMRGFESGKGFLETLRDTAVNMFKTLILRPIISAVVNPVAQAITGLTGLSGAANAGGLISNVSSIGSIGSQVFGGTMSAANAIGTLGANATGTGISGLLATNGAYGTAAGAAGGVSSFLGAIPGWGWAAMGVAALAAFSSNRFKSTESTGYGVREYDASGKMTSSQTDGGGIGQAAAALDGLNTSFQSVLKSLGATGGAKFTYNSNTGREGEDPQFYIKSGSYDSGEIQKNKDNVALATSRAIFAALQDSSLPKYLQGAFDGMVSGSLSQEQLNSTLANAQALKLFNDQLLALPFAHLADLSFAATQSLIGFSGGLDQLKANLGAYYASFYTQEEQRAQTIKNINEATAGSGLDAATASRESFRAIVEAQDLSTESGQRMYAALISASGGMDTLIRATEATAEAAVNAANKMAAATATAQQSIATLNGVSSSDYSAQMIRAAQDSTFAAVNAAMPWIKDLAQLKTIDLSKGGDFEQNYKASDQALIVAALAAAATVYTAKQETATAQTYTDTSYSAPADTSAADAAALRAAEVLQEQLGLQTQLNALLDTSAQALARQRDALADVNRAIFDHIQAIKATQAAYADSKTATDAAMAAVKRAVDAEKKTLSTQLQAAQSLSSEVGSIFDTLKSAVQDLYGSVENAALQSAAQARSFITNALTGAQATGSLPNGAELQNAIKAATSGISAGQYASQADMDYERLVLANQLSGLKNIAGDQLSEAEHQIKLLDAQLTKLDDQLAVAQAQYDALNGINTSVLSVKDAIDALTAAMTKQAGAGAAQLYATNSAATANPDQTGLDYWSNRIKTDGYDATKPVFDASVAYVNNSNSVKGWYGSTAGATANPDQQGVDYWTQQIQDLGAAQAKADFEKIVALANMPKFASGGAHSGGLRVVGENGWEVEATGQSRIWNQQQISDAMRGGNNDAEIVAELRALRAEFAQLRAATDKGNESAATTADVLVSVKNGSGLNMVPAPTF